MMPMMTEFSLLVLRVGSVWSIQRFADSISLTENVLNDLSSVTSGVPPVIGPTPNLIGCLEAMEAFKIMTGVGKVTQAPEILTFDLLDLTSFNVNEI